MARAPQGWGRCGAGTTKLPWARTVHDGCSLQGPHTDSAFRDGPGRLGLRNPRSSTNGRGDGAPRGPVVARPVLRGVKAIVPQAQAEAVALAAAIRSSLAIVARVLS